MCAYKCLQWIQCSWYFEAQRCQSHTLDMKMWSLDLQGWDPLHIQENTQLFDFHLSSEDRCLNMPSRWNVFVETSLRAWCPSKCCDDRISATSTKWYVHCIKMKPNSKSDSPKTHKFQKVRRQKPWNAALGDDQDHQASQRGRACQGISDFWLFAVDVFVFVDSVALIFRCVVVPGFGASNFLHHSVWFIETVPWSAAKCFTLVEFFSEQFQTKSWILDPGSKP